jgi:hypothetical protein
MHLRHGRSSGKWKEFKSILAGVVCLHSTLDATSQQPVSEPDIAVALLRRWYIA